MRAGFENVSLVFFFSEALLGGKSQQTKLMAHLFWR